MATVSLQHLLLRLLTILSLIISAQAPPSAPLINERQLITTTIEITTTIPFQTPSPTSCPEPCGFANQLCCEADQICTTDTNGQAQCANTLVTVTPPATCPLWSSSTYTIVATSLTTATYVVTYTRIQTDIQTIIGTASWQLLPQISDCCSPPAPPATQCNFALGETPCGAICCASGEFCVSVGQCAAIPLGPGNEGTTGMYSYYTTTYVQTDLETVTAKYSSYVQGSATAPLRPTSETLVTVTQS